MRTRHGEAALLVGMFSASGTVLAAREWDAPAGVQTMRPPLIGSHEALFDQSDLPAFSPLLRGNPTASGAPAGSMLQPAIGVVYLPACERHHFNADLPRQFGAAIFFKRSQAVKPLTR